jgi:hypothetical protein
MVFGQSQAKNQRFWPIDQRIWFHIHHRDAKNGPTPKSPPHPRWRGEQPLVAQGEGRFVPNVSPLREVYHYKHQKNFRKLVGVSLL